MNALRKVVVFSLLVILSACEGPAGPMGPMGPEGPPGPQGEPAQLWQQTTTVDYEGYARVLLPAEAGTLGNPPLVSVWMASAPGDWWFAVSDGFWDPGSAWFALVRDPAGSNRLQVLVVGAPAGWTVLVSASYGG